MVNRTWEGVDPQLVRLFEQVGKHFPFKLLEGVRTEGRQRSLVEQGKSKTLASKHIGGRAVDIAPKPIDWKDRDRFHYFGGYVRATADAMGIRIRWGGDWDNDTEVRDNSFDDLVHFELED